MLYVNLCCIQASKQASKQVSKQASKQVIKNYELKQHKQM